MDQAAREPPGRVVIRVVTVHWQSSRWIEPQLGYLERNMGAPYKVFAALNGISDPTLFKRFFFAEDMEGTHGVKLNKLAEVACEGAPSDDLIAFVDGDAFPVRRLSPWVQSAVADHELVAVRRDENLGDAQPHPSFCATTVGFWRELGGDWRGQPWTNSEGREVVDAGGRLLHLLAEHEVDWLPLLRTNTHNPHPVWFGVYAHRIYHHGGGFQPARAERVDWVERYRKKPESGRRLRPTAESPSLGTLRARAAQEGIDLAKLRPRHLGTLGRAAVKTIKLRREHRYFTKVQSSDRWQRLEDMSENVYAQLCADPAFFRQFDDTPDSECR
jgi:hypothetical protein